MAAVENTEVPALAGLWIPRIRGNKALRPDGRTLVLEVGGRPSDGHLDEAAVAGTRRALKIPHAASSTCRSMRVLGRF